MNSSKPTPVNAGFKSSKDLAPNPASFGKIFLQNQFFSKPVYPPKGTDLSGKTAIVTGANTGLGLECSRQLLSYNLSTLIIAVRSTEKGDKAANDLRSRYPMADIAVWELDMASYPSIQAFTTRVDTALPRVDFVVLNAGIHNQDFALVRETGHEEMFQVNYLSQALLTFLLIPVLAAKSRANKSGPAHITWVNSGLALNAQFANRNQDPLLPSLSEGPQGFNDNEWYSRSKLLAHFFLWKLIESAPASEVIVSLTDPGFVKGTNLTKKDSVVFQAVFSLFSRIFGRSVDVGASTIVDTLVNHGDAAHGSYLMSWKICP